MKTLKQYRKYPFSFLLKMLLWLSALVTMSVVITIVGYILIKGMPNLNMDLFAWKYNTTNLSMTPALINTFIMIVLALLVALPIGVFSAIYLVEYAKRGSKLVKIIRMTTETLQGIPSIVFGLFGFLFFVIGLGWNYSLLSGVLTMVIMILPLIMRTTEEALISVPDSYREGSFGLGAGKLRTVFKVVLPTATRGILSGVILAIGRMVGETAALIFTAGTMAKIPENLFSSTRTLSVHMYALLNEGLYQEQAYATAVVLLIFVLVMNALSGYVARKVTKGKNNE